VRREDGSRRTDSFSGFGATADPAADGVTVDDAVAAIVG